MEASNLLSEGLTLMVFGMGFVFVFLTLLVGVTGWMSKLVGRFTPEPVPVVKPQPAPVSPAPAAQDEAQLVAVLTAAVRAYRSRH